MHWSVADRDILLVVATETLAHQRLKQLALAFLRQAGGLASACEVRCPLSKWRLDVAGWIDGVVIGHPLHAELGEAITKPSSTPERVRCRPQVIIIECKQSRSDFLRDRGDLEILLRRREELHRFRESIEENRIRQLEPQLRVAGSSLFTELESWDFASSKLRGYRRVLRELRLIDEKLHGQTKFHFLSRYALADRLYLAAPRGLIRRVELPPCWGLLECDAEVLANESFTATDVTGGLSVTTPASALSMRDHRRVRLLRNIAIAAGRSGVPSYH